MCQRQLGVKPAQRGGELAIALGVRKPPRLLDGVQLGAGTQ